MLSSIVRIEELDIVGRVLEKVHPSDDVGYTFFDWSSTLFQSISNKKGNFEFTWTENGVVNEMSFQDLEMCDALADLDDDTLPDEEFIRRQAERLNQCSSTRIKEDMLDYIITLINKEFGGETEEDAIKNWERYKTEHRVL